MFKLFQQMFLNFIEELKDIHQRLLGFIKYTIVSVVQSVLVLEISYVVTFLFAIFMCLLIKPIVSFFLFSIFGIKSLAGLSFCVYSDNELNITSKLLLSESSSTEDSYKGLSDTDYVEKCLSANSDKHLDSSLEGNSVLSHYDCPQNSYSSQLTDDSELEDCYDCNGPRRLITNHRNLLDSSGEPIKYPGAFPSLLRQTVSVLSTTDNAPYFASGRPDNLEYPTPFSGTPRGFLFESEKELQPIQVFMRRFKKDFSGLGGVFAPTPGNMVLFIKALKEFFIWFTKLTLLETDLSIPLDHEERLKRQYNRDLALSSKTLFEIVSGNFDIIPDDTFQESESDDSLLSLSGLAPLSNLPSSELSFSQLTLDQVDPNSVIPSDVD